MKFNKIEYFRNFVTLLKVQDLGNRKLLAEMLKEKLEFSSSSFRKEQLNILSKVLKTNAGKLLTSANNRHDNYISKKELVLFENFNNHGARVKEFFAENFKELGYQICSLGEMRKYADYWYDDISTDNNENEFSEEFLFNEIKGSLNREYPNLLATEPKESLALKEAVNTLKSRYLNIYHTITDYLKKHHDNVSFTVVWGGMLLEAKATKYAMNKFNIDCYALEFSFDKSRFYFDRTGIIGNQHSYAKKLQLPNLTTSQNKVINEWIGSSDHAKSVQPENNNIKNFIEGKKVNVLLLCQCGIDTVITYDSPNYETTFLAYEDVFKAFKEKYSGYNLIIKLHPGDLDENKEKIEKLANRYGFFKVVNDEKPCNVYDLMQMSDYGITINSQSGLEMMSYGKNVLCLGNSFYANQGFGISLNQFKTLSEALDALFVSKQVDMPELKKYLYHYLFEFLYDENSKEETQSRLREALLDEKNILTSTRLLIVHPSGSSGGSGFYLQELAQNLALLGWEVKVFCEGTTQQTIQGIEWYRLKFDGFKLSHNLRNLIANFDPNVILQVGVRTKPMRSALEAYYLSSNPIFLVQAEDDEESAFMKSYPSPDIKLVELLDKPSINMKDLKEFLGLVDWDFTFNVLKDPNFDRWVEPIMRVICYKIADGHCSIWHSMADRLKKKFDKPSFILPPIVNLNDITKTKIIYTKSELFTKYNIKTNSYVIFVNGTVYPYSNEFNIFVDAIKYISRFFSKTITLLVSGRIHSSAAEYTRKTLKGCAYYRSMKSPKQDDYEAMVEHADICTAPGLNDTFNKYRMSSRLVKPIMKKKAFITFKAGFGDDLTDYKHGLFSNYNNKYEMGFLILVSTNQLLKKYLVTNCFQDLKSSFDSTVISEKFINYINALQVSKETKTINGPTQPIARYPNSQLIQDIIKSDSYKKFVSTDLSLKKQKDIINLMELSKDNSIISNEVFAFIGHILYPKEFIFINSLFKSSYEMKKWDISYVRYIQLKNSNSLTHVKNDMYMYGMVLYKSGNFLKSFKLLKELLHKYPEDYSIQELLLTVAYSIDEKNSSDFENVSMFIIDNYKMFLTSNTKINYKFLKYIMALCDSLSVNLYKKLDILKFYLDSINNFDIKKEKNLVSIINSYKQMCFLHSALAVKNNFVQASPEVLRSSLKDLSLLVRNFGDYSKLILSCLEANILNPLHEKCVINSHLESSSNYNKGYIIYISHIFFSKTNNNNLKTKQSDSFLQPRKVFLSIINRLIELNKPIIFRMQYHNNKIDENMYKEGWEHVSHHTSSSNNKIVHYHIKQAPITGYVSIDSKGYSGWSSMQNISKEDLLNLKVNENFVIKLKSDYLISKESKYQQENSELDTSIDFVFCALQIPTDNVANLSNISTVDMLKSVVNTYRESGIYVIVKRHPLCTDSSVSQILSEIQKEKHVIISNSNVHYLLDKCKAVYTINSGVGMEALFYEKPVFTFGKSEYQVCTEYINDIGKLDLFNQYDFTDKKRLIDNYLYYCFTNNFIKVDSIDFDKELDTRLL